MALLFSLVLDSALHRRTQAIVPRYNGLTLPFSHNAVSDQYPVAFHRLVVVIDRTQWTNGNSLLSGEFLK
jgi:hypothetical protein